MHGGYPSVLRDTAVRAQLLKDMIADPAVKNRVMIDVMNEPGERCVHACLPAAPSCSLSAGI